MALWVTCTLKLKLVLGEVWLSLHGIQNCAEVWNLKKKFLYSITITYMKQFQFFFCWISTFCSVLFMYMHFWMFYFVVLSIFASQEFRSHDFALLINRKQHFTVGLIHLHVAFISRICFWLPYSKCKSMVCYVKSSLLNSLQRPLFSNHLFHC